MQMHRAIVHFLIYYLAFLTTITLGDGGHPPEKNHHQEFRIGAIVDYSTRSGKEDMTAMNIAIQDYYKVTGRKPVLHTKDSRQDPVDTTFAAIDLINEKKVGAILDFSKFNEVDLIGKLGSTSQVPILSYAEPTSLQSSKRWPYHIQAAQNSYKQMKVVADIVGTWRWRLVNIIYEDVSYARLGVVPLVESLKEMGSQVNRFLALPPYKFSLSKELELLKSEQCRVFIVHTSLELATHLFKEAKKLGLMGKDSVWIITSSITDHLDFANVSVISTMHGTLGVKTYFPQNKERFMDFKSKFQNNFHLSYPKEGSMEPGISALQAYDAVWVVALAMEGRQNDRPLAESLEPEKIISPLYGKLLLEKILLSKFVGLTGDFKFINTELAPSRVFGILNVVGRSYRELGYWSEGKGFSKTLKADTYNMSMETLGQLLWPGSSWSIPRGWAVPTSEKPLIIGVPNNPAFDKFMGVSYDAGGKPFFSGLSVDVFKAALRHLPYDLPYNFTPHNGTYYSLIEQVHYKKYDAAIGDIAIVANRNKLVDFSHSWSDSGIQMVVYRKPGLYNRPWLFFKPFTKAMWASTTGITIYNGFTIWLMERMHHPELNGSISNKVGALIWISITSLFSLHGERLHTNLSRMTMVVWVFVAIVVIQSYSASLTSMLTIQHINLKDVTVDYLKASNAKVGCDGKSFVVDYLENGLKFNRKNIKEYYNKSDYPPDLLSGEISAAFLEVPYVKLFIRRNCKNFIIVGDTFKAGGFGFAFPKGSPLLPDITQAVLEVAENGELRDLENALLKSYNCPSPDSEKDIFSLDVTSFWGLFLITGGTSTAALIMYFLGFSTYSKTYTGGVFERGKDRTYMHVARVHDEHAMSEHSKHGPNVDERCMFAPEMGDKDIRNGFVEVVFSDCNP